MWNSERDFASKLAEIVRESSLFTALKVLSYVAHAAMAGALLYAVVMAVRYWPGIAV